MPSNISFNPYVTTNAPGTFSIQSEGFVQGVALDDPAVRFYLAGGPLSVAESLPMWGGVAIYENIPVSTANASTGSTVGRATTITGGSYPIAGFSVLNQAAAWVTSPQSECPSAGAGTTVPYYRLGSQARIALAIDPSLVTLDGGATNQAVTWDLNNQRLAAVSTGTTIGITSVTSSYSASTGLYTFAVVASGATPVGAVGDAFNLSGITGTGANYVNGNQVVTSFTSSTVFSFQVAAASGAIATGALTGTIVLNTAPATALPVKILKINIGGSKIVVYDAVNNLVHWNNSGSTAICLI
jgi:hypothetical protein